MTKLKKRTLWLCIIIGFVLSMISVLSCISINQVSAESDNAELVYSILSDDTYSVKISSAAKKRRKQ